jgi:hypothetical protein
MQNDANKESVKADAIFAYSKDRSFTDFSLRTVLFADKKN